MPHLASRAKFAAASFGMVALLLVHLQAFLQIGGAIEPLAPAASAATPQVIQTLVGTGCPGTSQTCSETITHPFQLVDAGSTEWRYRLLRPSEADSGGAHCSSVRVHVTLDGNFIGTTEWMGWPGGPAPLSTTLSLGELSAGSHTLQYVGEGRESGCNIGDLIGWGGEVTITNTPPDMPASSSSSSSIDKPECSDGRDNDGDGKIDFHDPGCYHDGRYDPDDDDERDRHSSSSKQSSVHSSYPSCSGCHHSSRPHSVPDCRDGRDNDRDGKTDYPDDLGCSSPNDDSERGRRRGSVWQNADIDSNSTSDVDVTIDSDSDSTVGVMQQGGDDQDARVDSDSASDVDVAVENDSDSTVGVTQNSAWPWAHQYAAVRSDSNSDTDAAVDAASTSTVVIEQESEPEEPKAGWPAWLSALFGGGFSGMIGRRGF